MAAWRLLAPLLAALSSGPFLAKHWLTERHESSPGVAGVLPEFIGEVIGDISVSNVMTERDEQPWTTRGTANIKYSTNYDLNQVPQPILQGKLPSNEDISAEEEELQRQQVTGDALPGAGAPRRSAPPPPPPPPSPPAEEPAAAAPAASCGAEADAEPGTRPPTPQSGSCQPWVDVMQDALAFSLANLASQAPPALAEAAAAAAASLRSKVAGVDADVSEGALRQLGEFLAARAPRTREQARALVEGFVQAYPAHAAALEGQDPLLLVLALLTLPLLLLWELIGVIRLLLGGLMLVCGAVRHFLCLPLRRRPTSRGAGAGARRALAVDDAQGPGGSGLEVFCRGAKQEEAGPAVELLITRASRLLDALSLEGAADQGQFSLPTEWTRSLGVEAPGPQPQQQRQQHPTLWRVARRTPASREEKGSDESTDGALARALVPRSIRLVIEAETSQPWRQASTAKDLAACSTASGGSLATQRSLQVAFEEVQQEPPAQLEPLCGRERITVTSPSRGPTPAAAVGFEADSQLLCGNGAADVGGSQGAALSWQRHVIAEAASPQRRSPVRTLQVVPENEEEDDADRGAGSPVPTISIVPPATPESADAREAAEQQQQKKPGLLRAEDALEVAACLYSVGEAVELLDGDGVSWVEAQVLATFPTEGTDRVNGTVYSIPRGAVKISCASGQKFVLAQDVEAVLRKPTGEDRAVPRLPEYLRVSERLGAGAYGEVFLCEDSRDGSQVAVKWVRDFARDPLFGKRILREIRILAALEHENLLKLQDLLPVPGPDFDDVYIVMPCLQYDLHKAIYSKMQLSEKHAQAFICQILRGLKYLHSAGVVHRDLKPSNILVNKDCTLRIADLGLARGRVYDEETLTDYVVTRWYRAPELMLLPSGYFEAIDIWSVGCIHVEILTRRPLFRCENHVTMLRAIADTLGFKKERDLSWLPEDCKQRDTVLAFIDSVGLAEEPSKPLKAYLRAAPASTEFVHHLLRFDPNRRSSATEALGHSYLSHLRDPMGELTAVKPFAWDFDRFEPTAQALKDRVYAECARRHPEILSRDAELLAEHNRISPLLEEAAGSEGPRGPPPSRAPARSSSTGGPGAAAAAASLASPA